ncbi:MAG: Gfo/Idh/MocA family oxidoreductase [Gammaproteobacteria bacterium]|nr:Gfo/Idh/MocA family oxidoreductase [Gammaproteobacteria bacterium]
MNNKIKVAVIGCGRMGLHHMKAIEVLGFSQLVAVADTHVEESKVRSTLPEAVRFFADPVQMLETMKPDIVHIVTPPDTHVAMARLALEHGAHIYVEKPFALSVDDTQTILDFAKERNLKVCAGHQVLFQHSGQNYRRYMPIVRTAVHIESYFSFKTVRRVDGGLMGPVEQVVDILPHPVYLMLDAFEAASTDQIDTPCEVIAVDVHASGEVRAFIKQGDVPAILTVTLRGRPIESYLRIVGTNGSLWVDFVISGITRLLGPGFSVFSAVLNPFIRAKQISFGTIANIYRMLTRKHKSYAGLAELIDAFHHSVADGISSPVSPYAIRETVRLCELIGSKLQAEAEHAEREAATRLVTEEAGLSPVDNTKGRVLVTGGTGFLGRVLVQLLRGQGWAVRVVARRIPSSADRIPGVEYVHGDIGGELPDSVFESVDAIAHLAAETAGGKEAHERNTIGATRLLLEAAARHGIRKFLHTSSIAVLKSSHEVGGPLSENSPVDIGNLARGPYVWGKAEAERLVTEFSAANDIEQRQIRLGPLVDFKDFTPPGRLGREVGPLFVAMGLPGNPLSVCDVHTAAEVIRYYLSNFEQAPAMLNLVESPQPTRGDLVRRLRAARPELRLIWLPFPIVRVISATLKLVLKLLKPANKPLDLYSAFASEKYDGSLAAMVIRKARGG